MQKDNGTRTLSQSGGNGNCTAERLVGSPPRPSLANIREEGCGSETLLSCGDVDNNNDSVNEDGRF